MNTGGPAFPRMSHTNCYGMLLEEQNGMTLRDYFAAKAMQGLLSSTKTDSPEIIANDSYTMADAMLKAREQ